MNRPIQLQTHPFRLLLYLEWILLGITILTEFQIPRLAIQAQVPILSVLSIVIFGLMGLRLPTSKLSHKIFYTSLEFGLILLATILGGWSIRFPCLYLVVVIRSCLIFNPPGRLIVAGLAFLSFLLTLFLGLQSIQFPVPLFPASESPTFPGPAPERLLFRGIAPEEVRFIVLNLTLNAALLFGLVLVFVLLLINALLGERRSREKLALAHDQLQQYALQIQDQATLQERNRIARDIHDSLGHALTAINIQLEGALKLWQSNPTKALKFLAEAKRLGSTALTEVRQSVSTLRSDPLKGRSLEEVVLSLAEDFHRSTGVLPACSLQLKDSISAEVTTAVYRILQEALTNVCKYAAATEVKIQLITSAELYLIIEDNGVGFSLDKNSTGFGLQGMRERTLALGGQFDILTAPSAGCKITVQFPLPTANNTAVTYGVVFLNE